MTPAPRQRRQAARCLRTLAMILAFIAGVAGLGAASPAIERWERENGYPFGLMCQLYGSCRPESLERLGLTRKALP